MATKVEFFELLTDPAAIFDGLRHLIPEGPIGLFEIFVTRALGRHLNRRETRGVRSAMFIYRENEDQRQLHLFNENGHSAGHVNLTALRGIESAELTEPDAGPFTPDIEESSAHDRYDDCFDQDAITINEDPEGLDTMHFRKIPPTDWDVFVFALENYCSVFEFYNGPRLQLYRQGYKQVSTKVYYSRGVLNWHRTSAYDETGLLLKQEFFSATPWGAHYLVARDDWLYDKEKRMVACRKTDIEKGRLERFTQYDLDDQHRIRCARRYFHSDGNLAELPQPEVDGIVPPPGMDHRSDTIYHYDSEGRLSAVDESEPGELGRYGRTLLEYNAEGLLISERCFNAKGDLDSESTITYPNTKQVVCITRWYRIPVIDD